MFFPISVLVIFVMNHNGSEIDEDSCGKALVAMKIWCISCQCSFFFLAWAYIHRGPCSGLRSVRFCRMCGEGEGQGEEGRVGSRR